MGSAAPLSLCNPGPRGLDQSVITMKAKQLCLAATLAIGFFAAVQAYAAEPVPAKKADAMQGAATPEEECGSLFNSVGPFDYRTRHSTPQRDWDDKDTTRNHFDPAMTRMRSGELSQRVLADFDFLLREYPNHYPTLEALIDYDLRGGKIYTYRTTECYFERARRFQPDDVTVLLYEAFYFTKKNEPKKAFVSYEKALALAPDSADVNYNIGLWYERNGEYDKALHYAHIAYAMGYPLPGLRDKLVRAGKWREDEPANTTAEATPKSSG
jgi:tetratricopeptide (TPR) repeat protein